MKEKWFQILLDKLKDVWGDVIIVVDNYNLGKTEDVVDILKEKFKIHHFVDEIGLRSFLKDNAAKQVIVFKSPKEGYIPYDIEQNSELVVWQLKDVFPKLHISAIKDVEPYSLQKIYEAYKTVEKSLAAVDEPETRRLIDEWLGNGSNSKKLTKLDDIMSKVKKLLNAEHIDWRTVGLLWGEIVYIKDSLENPADIDFNEIDQRITVLFSKFIFEQYHKLFYESYVNAPITVDRVLHYLGNKPEDKKAIICFDGMGFQEWYCLKDFLIEHGIDKFAENAVFALLPTITSVSRKALFYGSRLISNFASEHTGFKRHISLNWKDGIIRSSNIFLNNLAQWRPEYLEYDYLGIIVGIVDELVHSQVVVNDSKRLLQANFASVLDSTGIEKTITELLSHGYSVYITSDHGSIWCKGNGYFADKYLVDERARRALLYPNMPLAVEFANKNNVSVFEHKETLGDSIVVFPRSREMFGKAGELAITHGGIHIEEVIIPFIEVL